MNETARISLLNRFERMKGQDRLIDMKFCLGATSSDSVEAVCAEINHLHDLADDGKLHEVKSWGDTNRTA